VFDRESDMTQVVDRWMQRRGLQTKSEFVTPWGICDLVGLSFDKDSVSLRLGHRQTRPISSITRAAILLQIPDVESRRSTTLDSLARHCVPFVPASTVADDVQQLIRHKYVVQKSKGRLQKVNGWVPLQERMVAVELKLSRIEEAMRQAHANQGFADESYVAFPSDVARRVSANASRWSEFFSAGIGLISVSRCQCRVLVPATKAGTQDEAIQMYCVEKFWRTRPRGS